MKRSALSLAIVLGLSPLGTVVARSEVAASQPSQTDIARAAAEMIESRYSADAPGAAVLVARGDAVIFRAARGEADTKDHVALKPDSVFRIGSLTKQFTAAGLLKLVEAGKVKLDDPISKYVPGYPGGDRITILQLLDHTAGVKNYTRIPAFMKSSIEAKATTAQMIDVFKDAAPDFEPGSSWAYSNSGYVLVGAVIEAVTQMPWHTYLEQTLFKPLSMSHTGFGDDPKFAALQVHGYSYQGGKAVPTRRMSLTQAHAAGGLVSNVDDLLIWTRALHGGRVLATPAYTQMITPIGKAADPTANYGFGIFRTKVRSATALEHGGNIFGFVAALSYLPAAEITVVVLENDDDERGVETAPNAARRLAAVALGDPYPAVRAVKVDTEVLHQAEGVYQFGGIARVLRVVDGVLTTQRPGTPPAALTPIAPDDFLYADGFNRLKIERDASGTVTGVRLFIRGDGDGDLGVRTKEPLPLSR